MAPSRPELALPLMPRCGPSHHSIGMSARGGELTFVTIGASGEVAPRADIRWDAQPHAEKETHLCASEILLLAIQFSPRLFHINSQVGRPALTWRPRAPQLIDKGLIILQFRAHTVVVFRF